MFIRSILFTGSALLLIGCGGGGDQPFNPDNPDKPEDPIVNPDGKTIVDVLAIYNSEAHSLYPGSDINTRLNHVIAYANIINDNSKVDLFYNLVHSEEIGMDQSLTSDETLRNISDSQGISDMRNQHKADEVFIYRPYANDDVCGLAWINTPLVKEYGYAHITIDCPSDTTAHEAGHNFGLAHSHKQPGSGIYEYSFGHGIENEFATTMSYLSVFNVSEYEPVYSSPLLDCKGQPCGIEEGYSGAADAARSIREVKSAIASFN